MIHDEEKLFKGLWRHDEVFTGGIKHLLLRPGSEEGPGMFYGRSVSGYIWRPDVDITGWSNAEVSAYLVLGGTAYRANFTATYSDSDIWVEFPDDGHLFPHPRGIRRPLFRSTVGIRLGFKSEDTVVMLLNGEPARLAN